MEWSDEGFLLALRPFGEADVIASVLTLRHGRHAGLVKGGQSRRKHGLLQVGNRLALRWRARLAENLGTLGVELVESVAARFLDDPDRLAALSAACALVEATVPEREPHPRLHDSLATFATALVRQSWAAEYVRWELALLADLGFGLDLSRCAATGGNDGLAFVSPKSGRAVSLSAGEPYRRVLLPLPAFLVGDPTATTPAEIKAGLDLTAFFLERHVLAVHGRQLPPARQRLAARLAGATGPLAPAVAMVDP